MTDSAPAVVWLRHDLRLTDNTALYAACQAHRQVKLIFTLTPGQWEQHAMSPSQQALIFCQLHALNTSAAALGITLHVQPCHTFEDAADWLAAWCREHRIPAVYVNKQYGLNEQRRDARFAARLPDTCRFYAFDDSVLLPPGSVSTQQGGLYKVFTPFRRAFLTTLMQTTVRVLPVPEAKGPPVSWHRLICRSRSMPFSLPEKRPHCSGWRIFVRSMLRITKQNGIFRRLTAPAASPRISPPEFCPPASA